MATPWFGFTLILLAALVSSGWMLCRTGASAEPLPHLALALASFFLLWKRRRLMLLPLLLLWGPAALIQGGVTFPLGLLTPGGDAEWMTTLGIPPLILLANGITFLVTGVCLTAVLLDLI